MTENVVFIPGVYWIFKVIGLLKTNIGVYFKVSNYLSKLTANLQQQKHVKLSQQ